MNPFLLGAALFALSKGGIEFSLESETAVVDPGRSVFVRLELKTPAGRDLPMPDLRDRVKGFSLVEDFAEEPEVGRDGSKRQVVNWKLVPEPCAREYAIRPLVVGPYYTKTIRFENPAAREPVTGGMEVDFKKDLPPLSWRLVGMALAGLTLLAGIGCGLWQAARYLARRVREHRMSPIERAWAELERLIRKGLPGRGRYKDFYVELTMVVRRYVQRKYGIRAPHLTTDEFFAEVRKAGESGTLPPERLEMLREFLSSADLVKFAGVEATPEMADAATEAARGYLTGDSERKEAK